MTGSIGASSHGDPGDPSGHGVQPLHVDGNRSCTDLINVEDFLFAFKLEPVVSGTFPLAFDGLTGSVTVTVRNTDQGQLFDFECAGDFAALAVIVQGGPAATFYDYRAEGETSNTDLHAPVNPGNNMDYGLSHITFPSLLVGHLCFVDFLL